VTAHDGFTLNDLVSYNQKHNEANKEDNQDGTNDNASWNMGVEGPTDNPEMVKLRERQKRNLLATLLLSQGVPMICGGDEIDRTQHGNNNAYCQDNEISWYDWNLNEQQLSLLKFTKKLVTLRKSHPNLRRRKFYQDRSIRRSEARDILWLRPDGEEMTDDEWTAGWVRCLGVMLNGETLDHVDEAGEPILDDTFLMLLNCHREPIDFYLPPAPKTSAWLVVIYTDDSGDESGSLAVQGGKPFPLVRQSLALLRAVRPDAVTTRTNA